MERFLTPYGLPNSGQEKLQFTPFGDGPKPGCSDGLRAGIIESHNFFVLGAILVKFHIQTWLIERFPMAIATGSPWVVPSLDNSISPDGVNKRDGCR